MASRDARPTYREIVAILRSCRVVERTLDDARDIVYGQTDGRTIEIDPRPSIVDTLVHEAIHALRPTWSEARVTRETARVLDTLRPTDWRALYRLYCRRRRRAMG